MSGMKWIMVATGKVDGGKLLLRLAVPSREDLGALFMGEHELARGMSSHVLARMRRAADA